MSSTTRIIAIQVQAPPKVAPGAACNGCGVCCLWEPCPLGVLLGRATTGACRALLWDAPAARYFCGAVKDPQALLATTLPQRWHGLRALVAWALPVLARRYVGLGLGCDSSLVVQHPAQRQTPSEGPDARDNARFSDRAAAPPPP